MFALRILSRTWSAQCKVTNPDSEGTPAVTVLMCFVDEVEASYVIRNCLVGSYQDVAFP